MREFYRGGGESERRIGRRIFKGLFVNALRIEDAIYFSRRESLSNARRARPGFLRIVERFDGAAMIFPIQPPLMERDDKAATVIIAVVYGARRFRVCVWVCVCVCVCGGFVYRVFFSLSFSLFLSLLIVFISPLSRLRRSQRKHFCRFSNPLGRRRPHDTK